MSNDKDNFNLADLTAGLKDEDRAGLMNALKNKLMAGQRSEILENLTPQVRSRVEALREIQGKHDELEAKFREERAALEAKYEKLYQPLYTKRYEIVNGITEVKSTPEDTKMDQGEEKTAEAEKGVPSFWLTALKNNDVTSEEVTEHDEEALKYLKDIKWCKTEEPKGFKLEFFFDSNPYFKNTVLTKSYHMIDEDEPLLEKAIGTEIDWYPGKCLTQKILKKKPKKGSNAKPVTKMEDCESFFNFFNPPEVPDEDEDIDEERAEELQNLMEQDYDIGSAIREKIIPHAVSWFTGEAMEGEEFDLDDDEDDDVDEDEDEDEEDEEDEEDDDEDEEDSKTKKKPSSGHKKGGRSQVVGDVQQGERPPECKQQ